MMFVVAFIGGCMGEFLTLYEESRHDPATRIKYARDARYWIFSFLMALVGGGIAVAYGFKEVHVFGALYTGASAPVLIKSGFASFAPTAKPPIS
jgi:hypothetical protein